MIQPSEINIVNSLQYPLPDFSVCAFQHVFNTQIRSSFPYDSVNYFFFNLQYTIVTFPGLLQGIILFSISARNRGKKLSTSLFNFAFLSSFGVLTPGQMAIRAARMTSVVPCRVFQKAALDNLKWELGLSGLCH